MEESKTELTPPAKSYAESKPAAKPFVLEDSDKSEDEVVLSPAKAPSPSPAAKKAPAGKRKLLNVVSTAAKRPAKNFANDSDSDDIFTKKVCKRG